MNNRKEYKVSHLDYEYIYWNSLSTKLRNSNFALKIKYTHIQEIGIYTISK